MNISIISLILSIILLLFIGITIIGISFWLNYNKTKLSERTDKLHRLKTPVIERKFSVVIFDEKEDSLSSVVTKFESTTPDSASSLRSTLSGTDLEKLKPQTLMTWKSDDFNDFDTSDAPIIPKHFNSNEFNEELEIRKTKSENYVTFYPPIKQITEIQEPNTDDKQIELAFEDISSDGSEPELIYVGNRLLIKDKEFSLEND